MDVKEAVAKSTICGHEYKGEVLETCYRLPDYDFVTLALL